MTAAALIDGKAIANKILSTIKADIERFNLRPRLAILQIGTSWQSDTYVRVKRLKCEQVGIKVNVLKLDEETNDAQVLNILEDWNKDESLNGIIIQSPIPSYLNKALIFKTIDANKDVDGLGVSFEASSSRPFTSATALSVLECLQSTGIKNLEQKRGCVLGRGVVAGLPIYNALVALRLMSVVDSFSPIEKLDLHEYDVVVCAVGKRNFVRGENLKQGCIVIDVGTNRGSDGQTVVGDIHFESVRKVAAWITPVPGGVGPVTVASLIRNVYLSSTLKNQKEHNIHIQTQ